jgi:hypothetical protein
VCCPHEIVGGNRGSANVDIGTGDALSFILKSDIRNSIRSAYLKSNDPNWKSKVIKFLR